MIVEELKQIFHEHDNLVLSLDYDGTLVKLCKHLHEGQLSNQTKQAILKLKSMYPSLEICIVSGRDLEFLKAQFATLPVTLFAEHSSCALNLNDSSEKPEWFCKQITEDEALYLDSAFADFIDKYPGAYIERKCTGVAYHFSDIFTVDAIQFCDSFIRTHIDWLNQRDLGLSIGREVIEIKNKYSSKKFFQLRYEKYLNKKMNFCIAAGDDLSDEDLFKSLQCPHRSIKIGTPSNHATYNLNDHNQFLELLIHLTH